MMKLSLRNAALAAGFAAASAALPAHAGAPAAHPFAAQPVSAYEFSTGGAGFALPRIDGGFDASPLLRNVYGFAAPSFAASSLLSPNLTLDAGRNLDIAARFDDYGNTPAPLLSAATAPYLGLADGGHYAGFTYTPSTDLRLRLGASLNSDWLEHFTLDPYAANGGMPLLYHSSLTRSLIAGLSWDFTDYAGLGITAITSSRDGVPLGFDSRLPGKSSTDAIGISAHLGLGSGWVTKLAYSEGLSQLDLRTGQPPSEERSYSIAVAKHGLFGDDAVGFAFSHPPAGLVGSLADLAPSGDLPPMIVAHGATQAPETDFQLGYVTNFLDGALALQANAAYQMNYQGQTGATAVSLLSRAKIKF